MMKVGSSPAAPRMDAVRLVVVVLPCVPFAKAHDFCQHHGAGDNGNMAGDGSLNFGIVLLDGGGCDHDFCAVNMFGGVSGEHAHAEIAEMARGGTLRLV